MQNIIIPKQTEYQKWLEDYKIHLTSNNVKIGNVYNGYASKKSKVQALCKAVYYDKDNQVLLIEDIENNLFVFARGEFYEYQGIICCKHFNFYNGKKPLKDFVREAELSLQQQNILVTKQTLVDQLKAKAPVKIAGYLTNEFSLICQAYLQGWIV